jgi:hypothetical protein
VQRGGFVTVDLDAEHSAIHSSIKELGRDPTSDIAMTQIQRDEELRQEAAASTSRTETGVPPVEVTDEEALIKEAKRRHRRRVTTIAASFVVVGVLIASAVILMSATPNAPASKEASTSPRSPSSPGPPTCSPGQLVASVAFNQSGTDLGAIKLTNSSVKTCSLSGRPQVSVINGSDNTLDTTEVPYARAGLAPQPNGQVVLSANGTSPHGVVELDWFWCGAPPGAVSLEVRFSNWSSPLFVPNGAVSPAGFAPDVPSGCPDTALFAVDTIRALGPNGVIVPAS